MKTPICTIIVFLTLFMCFSQETKQNQKTGSDESIKGVVVSVDEDEQGNTMSVAIEVTHEAEDWMTNTDYYYVKNDSISKPLLEHTAATIKATGTVVIDDEGDKNITVKSFEILQNANTGQNEEKQEN